MVVVTRMIEKKFETPMDRERQDKALFCLCANKNLSYKMTEELKGVDAVLMADGGLPEQKRVAFAEVKGVNQNIGEKDYVRISVRKLHHCQKEQINEGLPTCIIWAFHDGIGYIWVKDVVGTVKWLGMKNPRPGSLWDRELMFYMDQDKLNYINY